MLLHFSLAIYYACYKISVNRVVTELEKRLHNKLKSSENRLNKKLDELFMKTGNGKDKADSVVNTKTD